jgi:hypothetical protein
MTPNASLLCDGCGQPGSPEHIAKRLRRLEWTTRYRPVHIGTLLLGAAAPGSDAEFLYADGSGFDGEAGRVLAATGISPVGKSAEATLTEFQRGGFMLVHVLECPLDGPPDAQTTQALLASQISRLLARIRRSLHPKRMAPVSSLLAPVVARLMEGEWGCALVLHENKPFALDGASADREVARLRDALAAFSVAAR